MSADKPCVLLVEDEPAQREILRYNLSSEGYDVTMADNGDDALLLAEEVAPDLILLDWMLPGVSGIEVLRRLKNRRVTSDIPTIMLSARSEEMVRVRGLETGADDSMVKPYSVSELMARIRTQLRRTRPVSVGEKLEYQDIVLDGETHRVTRSGDEVKLGPTEFRLLSTLMEKPGRVWSREQLLDRVWGREFHRQYKRLRVRLNV
ncbi:MAG: response regulator [Maritimibacter sp.]